MSGSLRQNLSSNTLFHFVDKKEYLIGILENDFWARFSYETFPKPILPLGLPMCCFCDIPLGAIKKHILDYGKYGIGMKKKYAIKKGITPVIYVHDKSLPLLSYISESEKLSKQSIRNFSDLLDIFPYLKTYEDYKLVNGRKRKIRFYDEREWRFVPKELITLGGVNEHLLKQDIEDQNAHLPVTHRLKFRISDINYIILNRDNEISSFISELRNIKRYYSNSELDILISKIITVEQIRGDF